MVGQPNHIGQHNANRNAKDHRTAEAENDGPDRAANSLRRHHLGHSAERGYQ